MKKIHTLTARQIVALWLLGADIELICKKASMSAVRDSLTDRAVKKEIKITANHFEEIVNENKPS